MNYAELNDKRHCGISGKTIDERIVRAMQEDWRRGDKPWVIAHRYSVGKDTVLRYCEKLPQQKAVKITNAQRAELLRQWA